MANLTPKQLQQLKDEIKGSGNYQRKAGLQYETINISAKAQMTILWVGLGVLVVGGGGYLLYRYVKNNKEKWELQSAAEAATKDLNKSNLTITEAQALLYANQIADALDGWWSNERLVVDILCKPTLSNDDIKLIYKKFGVREYTGAGIFESNVQLDLRGWIEKEVDGSDLKKLKERGIVNLLYIVHYSV